MTPRTGPKAALLSLLLMLCWSMAGNAQDVELLDVTDAFALSAEVTEPGVLALHFDIAPDYYLYRGRIKIDSDDPAVVLGEAQWPAGKRKNDQFLGEVEVYHGAVDGVVPFTLSGQETDTLQVAVQFQGCHETDPKICYPPHTQQLTLQLPAVDPAMLPPSMPGGGLGAALNQLGAPPAAPLAASEELPLPPEQAFRFEAIADGSHRVLARFTMAPGYYLYRDKSSVAVADDEQVRLGPAEWPEGEMHADEHFGTTEVFFREATVSLPLARDDAAKLPITLTATFQGCQDGGICYPLMQRSVDLVLPAASAAEMEAGARIAADWTRDSGQLPAESTQSEEQVLAGSLSGDGRLLALLAFFGAGLLLAFTPCVLPMIPILSGLIAGAGKISTARAFVLSLVYVLATCVVFTIAGVLAGIAGANLQAVFQTPWIIWCFALLFVALALSMFGFYELKLPSALQAKLTRASGEQKSGSLLGVAVMGVLSALIVGPCVAPPLAGAVLYIANTGDPVFGGLALFLLSLGMGLPLIAFGTAAGRLLPHTGAWMTRVNAVFGVVFLGLAIWMLSRILDPLWIMLMTGTLLVACAVYLGALERIAEGASGWLKLWKALGLILLVLGVAEWIGAAAGARDPLQPLAGVFGGSAAVGEQPLFRRIRNSAELDQALAAAQAAGKPLVLDYYADWCVACKEMERFTLSKPAVRGALEDFILVQADVTRNNADDKALLERFGLFGPPATIFFVGGKELRGERLIGFEESEPFLSRIGRVRARAGRP